MYTDGSKTNNGTAAAAVSGDIVKSLRITSHASIFTAEPVALNLALDIICRSCRKKFVIFSDSLSGLMAIHNCQLETGYVQTFIITTVNWSMPETLLLLFGYQVRLVSKVMNVQMRLQKQLSAQQSRL